LRERGLRLHRRGRERREREDREASAKLRGVCMESSGSRRALSCRLTRGAGLRRRQDFVARKP
jgi:hypothetical protein